MDKIEKTQCPWCGFAEMYRTWEDMIRGDMETVSCRNCGNKTDMYEALKQYDKNNPGTVLPIVAIDIESPTFIRTPTFHPAFLGPSWHSMRDILKDLKGINMIETAYQKRKRLSELNGEVSQIDRERQQLLEKREVLTREAAKLDNELRVEAMSKSNIQRTREGKEFEQIEITGVKGKAFRVQLRNPETGRVVASYFHQF